MLVKCIINTLESIDCPEDLFEEIKHSLGAYEQFNLKLKNNYVVKGISYRNGYPWYYVCEAIDSTYPMLYSAELFTIIDSRLSRCWVFGKNLIKLENKNYKYFSRITFKEWANNDYFYNDLIEGNVENLRIFKKYSEFMELEYPDEDTMIKASIIKDNWLQCVKCEHIWEEKSILGQIICEKCLHRQNNPLF